MHKQKWVLCQTIVKLLSVVDFQATRWKLWQNNTSSVSIENIHPSNPLSACPTKFHWAVCAISCKDSNDRNKQQQTPARCLLLIFSVNCAIIGLGRFLWQEREGGREGTLQRPELCDNKRIRTISGSRRSSTKDAFSAVVTLRAHVRRSHNVSRITDVTTFLQHLVAC